MKIRTGFVSNSSSTAFIVYLDTITKEQINIIESAINLARHDYNIYDFNMGVDDEERFYSDRVFWHVSFDRNQENSGEFNDRVTAILNRYGIPFEGEEW